MLDELPDVIGQLASRTLVPVMAKLSESVHLNHLGTDAVATAILTDASLWSLPRQHFFKVPASGSGSCFALIPV